MGADQQTGNDRCEIITAETASHAESLAQAKGMFVSSVELFQKEVEKIHATKTQTKKVNNDMSAARVFGFLLAIVGIFVFGYFLVAYDTTASSYSYSSSNVHNIGLMQNRLIGCMSGLFAMATGIITIVISYVNNRRVVGSNPTSPT